MQFISNLVRFLSTMRNPVVRTIAGSTGRGSSIAMTIIATFSKWLIIVVAIIGVGCVIFLNESLLSVVLQSDESTTTNKLYSPKQCSDDDLKTIQYQLPSKKCEETHETRPQSDGCSFSYATRCHDPTWLKNYYTKLQSRQQKSVVGRVGIVVGCNKAVDAINLLRMLSHNDTYNHQIWFERLQKNAPDVFPGVCKQENSTPFPLAIGNNNENTAVLYDKTVVHCIEPLPVTAQQLQNTLKQLSWSHDQFVIHNVAVSNEDGSILFPSVDAFIGQEGNSIADCFNTPEKCTSVPVFRLDTLLSQFSQNIDVMTIDVEGFDYEAILGAPLLLNKTKYVEFEYHYVGNWKQHLLSTVVDKLYNDHNFVCYWAGGRNDIWRITNCFLPYYNYHFRSNVACVNVIHSPELHQDMEDLFQATLKAGESIRYPGG